MKHVIVMTSTTSIGLMTLFIVDLVDMFFLSLLGEVALAAAIGFAGSILFFTTSISIGMTITCGALVSQAIGRQEHQAARRYAINSLVFGVMIAITLSTLIYLNIPVFLDWLGAKGEAKRLATQYLQIIIPSMLILTFGMSCTGLLRAKGDAKRAMWATVIGALVNLVLDPIFIFVLDMGIRGAAWASVAARTALAFFALYSAIKIHDLLGHFHLKLFWQDIKRIINIAIPAMLTNIATPFGNAYVMAVIASFGDSAVAGMSVISRLTPMAFGVIFALSGAVGPIIGQNYGAQRYDRVRSTITDSIIFSAVVVSIICLTLFLSQTWIVNLFQASGDAADLIHLFATWVAISFLFNGFLFIANATFNNIGYAHYSTILNFLKATLGTIPFVYIGAQLGNQSGALIGQAIGAVIMGCIALLWCSRIVQQLR